MLILATTVFLYYTTWTLLMVRMTICLPFMHSLARLRYARHIDYIHHVLN